MVLYINIKRKYSFFTVWQLEVCDQRVKAEMSERVSRTISRVKGTTYMLKDILAMGEGQAATHGSVRGFTINQTFSSAHVGKQRTNMTANNNRMHVCCI